MPDYTQGKIYLIWSPSTTDVYIGSTCQSLNKRFAKHKCDKIPSKSITDIGNAEIELIEAYPCNSKQELEQRERWYIENALWCINRRIPNRNKQEYHILNRDYIITRKKAHYQANKTILLAKQKVYDAKKKLTLS